MPKEVNVTHLVHVPLALGTVIYIAEFNLGS